MNAVSFLKYYIKSGSFQTTVRVHVLYLHTVPLLVVVHNTEVAGGSFEEDAGGADRQCPKLKNIPWKIEATAVPVDSMSSTMATNLHM